MLIDTHCHLTSRDLLKNKADVLQRAREANVDRMITIATDIADANRALENFATNKNVYLVAGIHPHEAAKVTDVDLQQLASRHHNGPQDPAWKNRLVAVGETGLDFHYDFAPRDVQERVFRNQLELACAVDRPVVIHAREAEEQVCDILADYPALRDRVVFHCFSRGPDIAKRILDAGFWLSFTGVVTFKNADEIQASAQYCPADRLMIETDAPFLSPEPKRKVRPNEPAFVAHTAEFLANLRGTNLVEFARATTANAERFFGLAKET